MSLSKTVELFFGHLAELDPHLRREQLLAQRGVVVELTVGGGRDLVEDEAEAADAAGSRG